MTDLKTDEEQVEELKKWWKENGRSVIAGLILGIGIIFAWQGWQQYRASQAAQASATYRQLSQAARAGHAEAAETLYQRLRDDFSSTPYAAFGALDMARLKVDQNQLAEARVFLDRARDDAPDKGFAQVARIRLARVLLDLKDLALAERIISEPTPPAFAAELAVLRGDLALAKGDREAARAAYQEALEGKVANPAYVRMKLNDLAPAS